MNKHIFAILFRRFLSSLFVLFLLISFVFIIIRLSPGDPSQKYLSPKLSPKLHEEISKSYMLDESITKQYIAFAKNIFKGDLGTSYNYRRSVVSVIGDYLPFTIIFSITSFIIQILASTVLVFLSLRYRNSLIDRILSETSNIIYAVPVFLTSVLLIYLFSYQLNIFYSSGINSFDFENYSLLEKILDYVKHLTLPLIAISLTGIPIYYKYLKDSIVGNLNSNYVLNLRSLGLKNKEIMIKHILPNSINSVIAVAGVELGILLGGALIVETIFSLPGMGQLTMNAVLTRDYPLIIGCTLTAGLFILIVNLFADVIRIIIDKRLIKDLLT
ncbi:MAG: ABC transporter permease [Bacteroidota bacterium]